MATYVHLLLEFVDDLILTGSSSKMVDDFVPKIRSNFKAHTIDKLETFLGIFIKQTDGCIELHHKGLIARLLQMFKMLDCNPSQAPMPPGSDLSLDKTSVLSDSKPFQQRVGSPVVYFNTTRPDIANAAGYLSRFRHHPTVGSWKCSKHVLRNLEGSSGLGVKYTKWGADAILGYSDSDWEQNKHDRKSIEAPF